MDYFATSLPTMLTFIDGPQVAHDALIDVLEAQLALLEGRSEEATAILERRRAADPADSLALALLQEAVAPAEVTTAGGCCDTAAAASAQPLCWLR